MIVSNQYVTSEQQAQVLEAQSVMYLAYPIPKPLILDSSNLKEFADDICKLDVNGEKLSKQVERNWEKEKLLFTSNFSYSKSVFKTLVLQICETTGLIGKVLKLIGP